MAKKVCPVVFRIRGGEIEVLAFRHPSAGKQFVKGGIEGNETSLHAALRELEEESGIKAEAPILNIGRASVGSAVWHFLAFEIDGIPEHWDHKTHDDFGHVFSFFWHPLAADLDGEWHLQFHETFAVIRGSLKRYVMPQ